MQISQERRRPFGRSRKKEREWRRLCWVCKCQAEERSSSEESSLEKNLPAFPLILKKSVNGKAGFRRRSDSLFVTYSRCPISPEVARDQIRAVLKDRIPVYLLVVQETHSQPAREGESVFHLHVLLIMPKELDIKNARYFDLFSLNEEFPKGDKPWVGKIEVARSKEASETFIRKGSNFVEQGIFPSTLLGKDPQKKDPGAASPPQSGEEGKKPKAKSAKQTEQLSDRMAASKKARAGVETAVFLELAQHWDNYSSSEKAQVSELTRTLIEATQAFLKKAASGEVPNAKALGLREGTELPFHLVNPSPLQLKDGPEVLY